MKLERLPHVLTQVMPADYDYTQELARAAFADMLHDSERNQLYRAGLKAAMRQLREQGKEVRLMLPRSASPTVRFTFWTLARAQVFSA